MFCNHIEFSTFSIMFVDICDFHNDHITFHGQFIEEALKLHTVPLLFLVTSLPINHKSFIPSTQTCKILLSFHLLLDSNLSSLWIQTKPWLPSCSEHQSLILQFLFISAQTIKVKLAALFKDWFRFKSVFINLTPLAIAWYRNRFEAHVFWLCTSLSSSGGVSYVIRGSKERSRRGRRALTCSCSRCGRIACFWLPDPALEFSTATKCTLKYLQLMWWKQESIKKTPDLMLHLWQREREFGSVLADLS